MTQGRDTGPAYANAQTRSHIRYILLVINVRSDRSRENEMLYTIAMVLLVLWLLGLVTSTTLGGLIHILLLIAIVVVVLQLIGARGGSAR